MAEERALAKTTLADRQFGKTKVGHDRFINESAGQNDIGLLGFKPGDLAALARGKGPEPRHAFANLLQSEPQRFTVPLCRHGTDAKQALEPAAHTHQVNLATAERLEYRLKLHADLRPQNLGHAPAAKGQVRRRRWVAGRIEIEEARGAKRRTGGEVEEAAFAGNPFGAASTDVDDEERMRGERTVAGHASEDKLRLLCARNDFNV